MKVTVENKKGKIEGSEFWYPLTDETIPNGEYQGYLTDQYCKRDKMGNDYWIDGLSHEYGGREAIRITNYSRPEKQPFEKYPILSKHIERMANSGRTGSVSEWSEFLRELNKIC